VIFWSQSTAKGRSIRAAPSGRGRSEITRHSWRQGRSHFPYAASGALVVDCGHPGKPKDSDTLLGRHSWIVTAGVLARGKSLSAAPAATQGDALIASSPVAVAETASWEGAWFCAVRCVIRSEASPNGASRKRGTAFHATRKFRALEGCTKLPDLRECQPQEPRTIPTGIFFTISNLERRDLRLRIQAQESTVSATHWPKTTTLWLISTNPTCPGAHFQPQ